MDEKKKPERPAFPNMRPGGKRLMPPAGLVWTLIILSLAVLFLVGRGSVGAKELDQSQFEEMLTRGDIISAKVASESENVLSVTGEYKLSPADAALVKQQNPNSNGNGQYKTKVLNSDSLQQLLREKVGKVEITLPDTWVTYMLSWLPMLIIAVLLWIFLRVSSGTATGVPCSSVRAGRR